MFNHRLVFQFLGLMLLIEGLFMWLCIPVSITGKNQGQTVEVWPRSGTPISNPLRLS